MAPLLSRSTLLGGTNALHLLTAREVWWSQIRPVQDSTESGSQIRPGPGFAFVTNVVSVSNTSSIEIILLLRPSLIKKRINLCDHFHSLERVVLFRALFFASRGYIEATAIGDAWRCLYAQPR